MFNVIFSQRYDHWCGKKKTKTAGPESLEDYFQKGALVGPKSLVHRYQAKFAKTVAEHLKVCHIFYFQNT